MAYSQNRNSAQVVNIDIIALLKNLWRERKTVIIWTCAFIVLGLFAALTMKREYSVSTVMVPQLNSKSASSSLSSLASLAGFDLSSVSGSQELSPLIYPQIVSSVPFRKQLMYTPLHYSKVDTAVCVFVYETEIAQKTVIDIIKKYTVELPFVILKAIRGERESVVLPEGDDELAPKPMIITEDEEEILKAMAENVSLAVDKRDGYLTLYVKGIEPIQTAELAIKAQQLLQNEITRFGVEKSKSDLAYIQARYDEIKAEAESYQNQLALITDRTQSTIGTRNEIERNRIQAKYTVANNIYNEMAKQLEQAKMQVKKDTPVFTVIQPVTVPVRPSNSRTKTLIIWTFLGFIIGCGIVLGRVYLQTVQESSNKEKNTDSLNG